MANQFPEKYLKKIQDLPDFIGGIDSMDSEDIKRKVLECEAHINDIEVAKEEDTELTEARDKVKEFSKPYREGKSLETAKLKYCMFVLESRGVNLAVK
jgi:hypothetical protein